MSTRNRQHGQFLVPETTNGPSKQRRETDPSPTRSPTPDPSKRAPKWAAEDLPEAAVLAPAKRASRRIAGLSVPPVPNPFTRFSLAKAPSSAAASSSKSAGKKRVADDCEEEIALSAKKTRPSIVTSRKKRVAASATRKVKKLPLQEELEALRVALPPAIRSHLDPPRDDKGPIPAKGRTFGEFLRWKTMYNDEFVKRITDEEHVTCKHCGSSFALCHDTAYDWYKWGRHRRCCIRGVDPDEVAAPVLLDQLLPRCTGHPAVDMLFPKEKGGPYYKLSWTYFVPRPGQSRPEDLQEAPAPSALTLSARPSVSPPPAPQPSVKQEAIPSPPHAPDSSSAGLLSRRLSESPRPCPWSVNSPLPERDLDLLLPDCDGLRGVELLHAAAEFMDRTKVSCNCDTFL